MDVSILNAFSCEILESNSCVWAGAILIATIHCYMLHTLPDTHNPLRWWRAEKVQCNKKERKPHLHLTSHCGCWSVLEANIEIPDTLVVNIAHVSLPCGKHSSKLRSVSLAECRKCNKWGCTSERSRNNILPHPLTLTTSSWWYGWTFSVCHMHKREFILSLWREFILSYPTSPQAI